MGLQGEGSRDILKEMAEDFMEGERKGPLHSLSLILSYLFSALPDAHKAFL